MHENLYLVSSEHNLVLIRFWCISSTRFRCCLKFSIFFYHSGIGQNYLQFYLIQFILSELFLNLNQLFSQIIYSFFLLLPHRGKVPYLSWEILSKLVCFTQKVSKHTKLIVELYICDNLNQLYRFFLFSFNKKN